MTGIERIAVERIRQLEDEGYGAPHDDTYTRGELANAAAAYTVASLWRDGDRVRYGPVNCPISWPWDTAHWRPRGRIEDLVRAGALIAAEIDRLERAGEAVQP